MGGIPIFDFKGFVLSREPPLDPAEGWSLQTAITWSALKQDSSLLNMGWCKQLEKLSGLQAGAQAARKNYWSVFIIFRLNKEIHPGVNGSFFSV